jgi:hypothetical protein
MLLNALHPCPNPINITAALPKGVNLLRQRSHPTVVSITTRFEVPWWRALASVRHRQTFLDERDELIFAQSLAPMRRS